MRVYTYVSCFLSTNSRLSVSLPAHPFFLILIRILMWMYTGEKSVRRMGGKEKRKGRR